MATLLLDTSIIIDLLNGRRNRDMLLRTLLDEGHLLACCPVNVAEIYAGIRPNEEARTDAFLRTLVYLPITWEIARLAGELKNLWARKGRTVLLPDAMIAAVALHHQTPLLTDNPKDFPMPELSLYPMP